MTDSSDPQTIGELLGLDTDVEAVLDVEVEITAVLGTAMMPISQILKLGRGAVVELNPVSYTHLTLPTICSV